MKLALVPAGPCEWRAQGRLLGRVELSLDETDGGWVERWAAVLPAGAIRKFHHGSDELTTRTAKLLGARCKATPRAGEDLLEIHVGLWAGLTLSELKARFSSAYRQLNDDPLAVQTPNGESLAAGADRICSAIRKRLRKVRDPEEVTACVLRPLALAAARCAFENGGDFGPLWEFAIEADEPRVLTVAAGGAAGAGPAL